MFQHRHYKFIAAIIADMDPSYRDQVATTFARQLQGTNPAFDIDRFTAAALGSPSNGRDRV